MQGKSCNSRFFTGKEQKTATIFRELFDVVNVLEISEFLKNGSKHLIKTITDQTPIRNLSASKGNMNPCFSRQQVFFTRIARLVSLWTQGQKLSPADLLSELFQANFYDINRS